MFALFALFLSSCYVTKYTYSGNVLDDAIGKDKNQILRTHGVPDRTMDDGKAGTILIYENFTQTTISHLNSNTYGQGSAAGAILYGSNGMLGVSSTSGRQSTYASKSSQTFNTKYYQNIYLNSNNIAYDFQTNIGGTYDSHRCLSKGLTWGVCIWILMPFAPAVAIPVINSAKKKGKICD